MFKNKIIIVLVLFIVGCLKKADTNIEYQDELIDSQYSELGQYINSKKEGLWVTVDKEGKLKSTTFYKEGKEDGPYRIYYPNGNICMNCNLKNGDYYGEWEYYYPNGNLNTKGKFDDNGRTGKWYYYAENGALGKIILYENNEDVKVLLDNKILPALPNDF